MFEGIVAKKLTKILGKCIKDLDAKQLKVGIWNGYVMLHNLELKSDALDEAWCCWAVGAGVAMEEAWLTVCCGDC